MIDPRFLQMTDNMLLPSLDQLPVEDSTCVECNTRAPAVVFMGYNVVICPQCKKIVPRRADE